MSSIRSSTVTSGRLACGVKRKYGTEGQFWNGWDSSSTSSNLGMESENEKTQGVGVPDRRCATERLWAPLKSEAAVPTTCGNHHSFLAQLLLLFIIR